ncbi:hypothetical protein OSTOST_09253, partial [Ostertagia ostertagi]
LVLSHRIPDGLFWVAANEAKKETHALFNFLIPVIHWHRQWNNGHKCITSTEKQSKGVRLLTLHSHNEATHTLSSHSDED